MNGNNLCPHNSAALQIIAGVSFKIYLIVREKTFIQEIRFVFF